MATISVAVRCAPAVPVVVTPPASRRAWWPAIASRVTLFCWPSATTYSWAPRPNALVVRNGVAEPRTVTTAAGALEIRAPRVHDRRQGRRFTSAILPPWARRSPKVTEVLPVLYLRGISTKDFEPALAEFFGSEAGLSASTIQRLTREWGEQLAAFQRRDLSQVDYVYLWADGVHFNIRLEHERLCCLVLIGVRADGRKELVAVGDGYRESTESWSELLRDLKRHGMRAPVLAIGDGALGFWGALREVFPESREQRCWVHYADLRIMPTWPLSRSRQTVKRSA